MNSDDPIVERISALERCLIGEANVGAGLTERLDILVRGATLFQERLEASESRLAQVSIRLEEILEVVTGLTALEYERKVSLSEDDDWIVNALAIGLNIMGDELAHATRELTDARDGALAASRAKSAFLANMSHELRTPLNAIIGYAELVQEEMAEGELASVSEDLGHVEHSARHLLDLIQDTLDLSKIEAGKMELVIDSFAPDALLSTLAASVAPMMREQGNELEVQIADDLGVCKTDRTKFQQIVLNLLSNAAKFTCDGVVRLRARAAKVGASAGLVVEVSDTGIGVAPAKLPVIFGAFNQADDSTSRDYGGTGLGLTISRHFAEMMGGELSVESVLGVGSTFAVRLPYKAPTEGPTRPSLTLPDNVVVVADRDPRLHDLLRRRLGCHGFAVLSAATCHDVLALTSNLHPVLIVLDTAIEADDSWEALAMLLRERESAALFVSGEACRGRDGKLGLLDVEVVHPRPIDIARVVAFALHYRQTERLGLVSLLGESAGEEGLREALERGGWGLDTLDEHSLGAPPDAVIVDLRAGLSGVSGLEVLPWPSCPVLLLVDGEDPPRVSRPHAVVDVRGEGMEGVCLAVSTLVHRSGAPGGGR